MGLGLELGLGLRLELGIGLGLGLGLGLRFNPCPNLNHGPPGALGGLGAHHDGDLLVAEIERCLRGLVACLEPARVRVRVRLG